MTFTINELDYTFSPATMNRVPVIGVSYTRNGESFAEWSAEASLPTTTAEAEAMLTQCAWALVNDTDDFQEVAQ